MGKDGETAWVILGLAVLIDISAGEYPAALHPVVWIGKTIAACLRLAPVEKDERREARGEKEGCHSSPLGPPPRPSRWWRQFLFGTFLTLLIVGLSAGMAWVLLQFAAFHPIVEMVVGAFLLKASFALRELGRAAMRVVKPLEEGNLGQARLALRSLCSRDPSELTREDLLAATIESLAENASDSFVAPLFFFVLFGVPGALAYRAINTLDSMIGYRGKYEALGKFAARLDDLANLMPARLTALLFLSTGWLLGGKLMRGWRTLRRDAAKTPSPNGGRPMAAMAGLLGVQLDKKDVYSLGDPAEPLTPAKVRQAWRIVVVACAATVVLCVLGLAFLPRFPSIMASPWIPDRFCYNYPKHLHDEW